MAADRPLLDLVARFANRLEDGDRLGHRLISAGLAPTEAQRGVLVERRQHLLDSLRPPADDEARKPVRKVVAALLGAFPTFGASREDADAAVKLIVRALDDVPAWAVHRAAGHFLRGTTKTTWSPDRAPTPPQIRAEAKLITLEVEAELHRLGQILDAEVVDGETTEAERHDAVARWEVLKAEMGRSNVLPERTDEEVERERAEMRRANLAVRRRESVQREALGFPPTRSPFEPRSEPAGRQSLIPST